MRRLLALTLILWALLACPALAESAVLSVNTPLSALDAALMDNNGQSVSTVLSSVVDGDSIYWTLNVTNNGASEVYLYTKDANGNWLRTDLSYQMSWFFGGAADSRPLPDAQPVAATEPSVPWPTEGYIGRKVNIRDKPDDERVQSRCGPGRDYGGAGAYKTYKVKSTKALFIENGYVYIDLRYETVRNRRVYFGLSAFRGMGDVPEVQLTGYPAVTLQALIPVFGPGSDYDVFDEAEIPANTPLSVFYEENDYVFAEFDCGYGTVRAWMPASSVKAK